MVRKLTSEQMWQEWKSFKKDLNDAIRLNDYMEVNSEYDIEEYFAQNDAENMLKLLDKIKDRITSIKVSLK